MPDNQTAKTLDELLDDMVQSWTIADTPRGYREAARAAVRRYIQEAIEREREACARIVDAFALPHRSAGTLELLKLIVGQILSRSTTPLPEGETT